MTYGSSQTGIESEPQLQPVLQLWHTGSLNPLLPAGDHTCASAATPAAAVRFFYFKIIFEFFIMIFIFSVTPGYSVLSISIVQQSDPVTHT